ncbi:MAG: ABC transporter ATP-binding protein [Chloroflexota bacterium]
MLDVQAITVTYGTHIALQDVSLTVFKGEIVALIGPNGSGKTTLIRAVSGVVPIKSGIVQANGKDIKSLSNPQRARTLAVVPQAQPLGGAFTVEQAVMMGRTAYMSWLGHESEGDYLKVHAAMERTDTLHLANRRLAELSGGEQQRVLLARALAQTTPILLLDEPTNNLDLHHQTSLLSLIQKLAHNEGLAVLLAMHDLNLVSLCADRIALLVNGMLETIGKPNEVLTEANISRAYQTTIQVIPHPEYDTPLVLPSKTKGAE